MTKATFRDEIEEAVPRLLQLARELTPNLISDHCLFILSEIKDGDLNVYERKRIIKKENEAKQPVRLEELMPTLLSLYDEFYDINLEIYRATRKNTIIDFRYYPRTSLDEEYRQKVSERPPMLHCHVPIPPWVSEKKERFDINWHLFERQNKLRLEWLKFRLRCNHSYQKHFRHRTSRQGS